MLCVATKELFKGRLSFLGNICEILNENYQPKILVGSCRRSMKINRAVLKNLTVFNFQALDLIKDLESEFTFVAFSLLSLNFLCSHTYKQHSLFIFSSFCYL